ncbi:ASN_collapsed_G0014420.mRNA.1.CDS.1 [Saccharomyces cerevisiae]|nr:ASN_collapsed_G0014420.mRNA.1.CDS.1 [Saccharomyces cerevisiae]
MPFSRVQLENITAPLIDRTVDPVKKALKDARITASDISDVLLVGGMSRMPKVADTVKKLFGKDASKAVNPDEAVALGAAIQAAVLSGEVTDVLLLDVTPLSLGIETLGGVFTKLIPRNSTIPNKKSQIFSTAASGQTSVEVKVFQGERELVKDNKLIGNFTLAGIPPAPKGIPQIEVTFDIDANGIINVSAKDLASHKDSSITVAGASGLSDTEIDRMVNEGERYKNQDRARRNAIETANKADQLANDTENSIKEFEGKLDKTDSQRLKDQISSLRELVSRIQAGDEVNDDDVGTKIDNLRTSSMKLFEQLYKNSDNPETKNGRENK